MKSIISIVAIRQKLHNYLEIADDKIVKAIYTIMENEIKKSGITYNAKLKKELGRRHAHYKSDKSTIINAAESRKKVQKIIKAVRKK